MTATVLGEKKASKERPFRLAVSFDCGGDATSSLIPDCFHRRRTPS
jgi:hypothetical protein